MDSCTGTSRQSAGPAPLRAVPDVDRSGPTGADRNGPQEMAEDVALLRDAAVLVRARQCLDGLLLQLTVDPFDPAAYLGLSAYLAGPGALALAAYQRVNASVRGS